MSLARNLRKLMVANKTRLPVLVAQTGISTSAILSILSSEITDPPAAHLYRLAQYFNLPVDVLVQ